MKVTQEDSGFQAWWKDYAPRGHVVDKTLAQDIFDSIAAQPEPTFEPIHITLETEGEAAWMWARLRDTVSHDTVRVHSLQRDIELPRAPELFDDFNAVYDACQGRYAKGE